MRIINKIINRFNKCLNKNVGSFLRKRYASFHVTLPYIINVGEHEELKGKVAVITGGSGAIGRACAFRLAAEGAKVYVCGSRPSSAQPVVDEIIFLQVKQLLPLNSTFLILMPLPQPFQK